MRKRSRVALIIVLVAVIGGISGWFIWPGGPYYQGKSLSHWLYAAAVSIRSTNYSGSIVLSTPVTPEEEQAMDAVRHCGSSSVPLLLKLLRVQDSSVKLKLLNLAARQNFIRIQGLSADCLNHEAMAGFAALGAQGADAVPELLPLYEEKGNENLKWRVLACLGYIGPAAKAAVPSLLRWLAKSSGSARNDIIEALAAIHADAITYLPELLIEFRTSDKSHEQIILRILKSYGEESKQFIPALAEFMLDNKASVRSMAVPFLRAAGAQPRFILGELIKAARDANKDVREDAVTMLGLELAGVGSNFQESLKEQFPQRADLQGTSASENDSSGTSLNPVVAALIQALRDPESKIRQTAARSLGGCPDCLNSAVPANAGTNTNGPAVNSREAIIAALSRATKDPNGSVRVEAVRSLATWGSSARSAIPALVLLLEEPDPSLHFETLDALRLLDTPEDVMAKELIKDVKEPNRAIDIGTPAWLMRYEKQTKPALLELLKDKDESVRKRAANFLRMIATAGANAAENH